MSITTVTAPAGTDRSAATTARLAFAAVAIAVLLAVAFVVGRVTADSTTSHTTSIVPAAHTSAGVDDCPRFRFC